ncbi:MAG: hypothetical protein R6T91_07525 [Bacteroidales bacterium]
MKQIKNNISWIVIIAALISVVIVSFGHHRWVKEGNVIEWDVKSYYSYLPAAIIHQDMTLSFLEDNPEIYDKMWPVEMDNGDYLIVTSSGLSILYSPFFLMAHGVATFSDFEADGYSLPYRFSLHFSALFYVLLGLIFLRKILKRFFDERITALTLLAIIIGTNLYYYTAFEAPMPHAYNFSLIAVFVWLTILWHENPKIRNSIGIGLLYGLIVLIRPTNVLVILFFILWDVKSFRELKERILFFLKRFDLVLIMILFFLIAWSPQFAYWKTVTDQWIFYSYGEKDAGFFFGNPQIKNILISYKKGWFVYTPLMFFAFIGIFSMIKRLKQAFLPVLVYILAMIYVLSSWWAWWFGGGFGLRAFIDTYAIMAIPLASLLDVSMKRKFTGIIAIVVLLTLTWFNTFQIRQYRKNAIHYWWMNKEAYWETFLKLHTTDRYWEVLTKPDYEKARKGIYEAIPVLTEQQKNKRRFEKEYKNHIYKQKPVMDSLHAISENKEVFNQHFREFMNQNIDEYIFHNKTDTLKIIKQNIRDQQELMEKIKEKAENRDISIDSMITIDAIYLFKQGSRQ